MSEIAACAHTKIKEITWNENGGTSGKFMCLHCNTDFIPLTREIRDFLHERARTQTENVVPSEPEKHKIPSMYGGQRGSEAGCYG